jgi:hypothetical protein
LIKVKIDGEKLNIRKVLVLFTQTTGSPQMNFHSKIRNLDPNTNVSLHHTQDNHAPQSQPIEAMTLGTQAIATDELLNLARGIWESIEETFGTDDSLDRRTLSNTDNRPFTIAWPSYFNQHDMKKITKDQ